jgi:pyruvate-formate lyase-activating enzyme
VWDELDPVMDAAMIDLKAFDDDVHRSITGMSNEPVLETIRPTNRELREPSVYRMAGYAELLRSEGIEQLTLV